MVGRFARRAPLVGAAIALAGLLVGCAAEYNLTLLPGVVEAPREPCAFEATTTFPAAEDYEEIGRLTVEFYPSHDLASFKSSVSDAVCHVGADVAVAMFDDTRIREARLFRRRAAPPEPR